MKTLLFLLLSFVAVSATISGLILISKPGGEVMNLSVSLLQGTPFKNFLVPGILLTVLIGGINMIAVVHAIQRKADYLNWAIAGGVTIIGWIFIQMIMIHAVHWLHFIYLGIGGFIILIAYQLKGKWAV
jgi:CHASE2 domain-containing sensor protein